MRKMTRAASPDAYVDALDGWRRDVVEVLRSTVRAASVLDEVVKWGHLVYLANGPVLLIRAEENRILFGFWRGQRLRIVEPRLKSGGKYEMATLELRAETIVKPATVKRLTREAVALNKTLGDPTQTIGARDSNMTDRRRRAALDLRGLSGREELFRLSGAARRDPAVASWFSAGPVELRSIARLWFQRMRQCGRDVRELMHDGCPVACVEDAAFGYVNAFKSHVNVGFFHGARLEDPAGLLEGSGKRMRHVRLEPDREPNATALGDLIDAAYADIKARLAAERATT